VAATKPRIPLKLLYYEACNIPEDAIAREKALKFGRAYLKRRLSDI
jgi:predicted GIY-YIG superfamily endonuclease